MPLYEYECKDCGVRFERQQSFKDEPLKECPECEGHVHRVIGATGVIFKGSGFYINDSRKSSQSSKSAKDS
jgi:putative FmdB family regulatory protein